MQEVVLKRFSALDVSGLEFENNIAIFEISAFEFVSL